MKYIMGDYIVLKFGEYGDKVTIDTGSTETGTAYPKGTLRAPVAGRAARTRRLLRRTTPLRTARWPTCRVRSRRPR